MNTNDALAEYGKPLFFGGDQVGAQYCFVQCFLIAVVPIMYIRGNAINQ
jgi:hypothetical protein